MTDLSLNVTCNKLQQQPENMYASWDMLFPLLHIIFCYFYIFGNVLSQQLKVIILFIK